MSAAPRSPASAARVVYAGIFASTIIVTLGALVVSKSLGSMTYDVRPMDSLALLAGLGALAVGWRRRARLLDRGAGQTAEQWWSESAGGVLVVWVLLELGSVIGAVLLFATGRLPVCGILAVLALAGLALSSPGRLART